MLTYIQRYSYVCCRCAVMATCAMLAYVLGPCPTALVVMVFTKCFNRAYECMVALKARLTFCCLSV
jgi:hypothetical protein